ncbi:DUF402 domain-containing protein [Mycoplasma corogypsi]|uniref:DUF402 domain-containing protein n=1 Tax=Mycoplasma corogypsi TaxID=2106 RepID=UPI0038731818
MEWDFSQLKVGSMISIQAYKHSGYLYRQWNEAKVIFHNKRHIVLYLKGTKVSESDSESSGWKYTEDALWFIPKESFYNAIILLKKDIGNYYYINIASKPIFEDNTIKFIDYDLDVKCYPDRELQVVDREEFTTNSKIMNYPVSLKQLIYEEIRNIITMYNEYQYFFNDSIIEYYLTILWQDKLINEKALNDYIRIGDKHFNEESRMFNEIIRGTKAKKARAKRKKKKTGKQ